MKTSSAFFIVVEANRFTFCGSDGHRSGVGVAPVEGDGGAQARSRLSMDVSIFLCMIHFNLP
ncbi:hypothetical protein G3436_08140 [Pseudomonas sp. MAFF212427]|uniref:Uncharacterized protein n=1 Tax=Pseudomonas brassicae TaxID=2708063 RepID=A0A6B3NKM4_9PSED|nr:hypothetical protein [Pseudomonas brassicae]NER63872.1 hypothetical protein [Pseudomonas brassicae]